MPLHKFYTVTDCPECGHSNEDWGWAGDDDSSLPVGWRCRCGCVFSRFDITLEEWESEVEA